jgi:hypothetical protein
VIDDWNCLFTQLGVIDHDMQIARVVRVMGWIGMLITGGWMVWRSLQPRVSVPLARMNKENVEMNQ